MLQSIAKTFGEQGKMKKHSHLSKQIVVQILRVNPYAAGGKFYPFQNYTKTLKNDPGINGCSSESVQ